MRGTRGVSYFLAAGLIVLAACSPKNVDRRPSANAMNEGIVGGSEVQAGDPVMKITAMLYLNDRSGLCTVSILSKEWMLSAGHCAHGLDPKSMEVVFDENIRDNNGQIDPSRIRKVVETHVNPRYPKTDELLNEMIRKAEEEGRQITSEEIDAVKDWGDISLIKIEGGLPAGFRAAFLPDEALDLQKNETVTLAGYGVTSNAFGMGSGSGVLRKVDTIILEPRWGTTEILLEQSKGKGACHGDSGGPAYAKRGKYFYLVGVTSRGVSDPQDTCLNRSAYTNVGAYRSWIRQVTGL